MTLKSVVTLLDVLQFANSHTAIVVPELGISVTYDSLRRQVLTMADALASAGIRRGDAVAIALPNGLPAIVSFLAASIAGTAAPLNPAYPYEEFLFFLGDTNARVMLCPPVGAEFARSAAADRKIPVMSVGMTDQGDAHLVDAPTGRYRLCLRQMILRSFCTPAEARGGPSAFRCAISISPYRRRISPILTRSPKKMCRSASCRCFTSMD